MNEKKNILRSAIDFFHQGDSANCLKLLQGIASPTDDLSLLTQYTRLASKLVGDLSDFPVIRVAFLGDATLDHWVEYLKFWLLLDGFCLQEIITPYGTWRQQVLDQTSDIYDFNPDVVWFFFLRQNLNFRSDVLLNDSDTRQSVDDFSQLMAIAAKKISALFIVNNCVPSPYRVYGNLEGVVGGSASTFIQEFNLKLAEKIPRGAIVFDMAHIAACFGLEKWEDQRLWYHSKHPFSFEAQSTVAFAASRLLIAARGRARKCVVLDLDNTLWGGVVGDDGVEGIRIGSDGGAVGEAYADFQIWLKALANRGIALAVCSKNEEDLAREPFLSKSGMILELDDFVSFKANWNNKADNIRAIVKELNLGLDSLVFIDDNPAERALIRSELPQVAVPELPSDPADFIHALSSGHWFETLMVSDEDRIRVRAYRDNAARTKAQDTATDLDTYLKSLEMRGKWSPMNENTLQRVAQLVNKTNQFHLTTTRYTESHISTMALSSDVWVGHFSLSDRFGDYGLIAVVILSFKGDNAIIDTWTMSCRVFSRRVEDFIFKKIWGIAKTHKCKYLIGKYIPTSKNAVVSDLYSNFGGKNISSGEDKQSLCWCFDLSTSEPKGTMYIREIDINFNSKGE